MRHSDEESKVEQPFTTVHIEPSPKQGTGHDGNDAGRPLGHDQTAEQPSAVKKPGYTFHFAFAGLALIFFVFNLDATTLGVALPSIAEDLNGTSLESFWANISYTLCVVITQPQWASISDAFGRKPPLYVAMILFFVGSILFAVAKNMGTIIAGRVLQGLGGGGIDVLAEIILTDMTTLQERSFYLGIMGIPIAIGNLLGPIVGALFSTFVSWRWIGWINLPLLGVAFPLIVFFLRLKAVPLDASLRVNLKRLDWFGMALSMSGIVIFVLPLSWAGSLYPWSSWRTLLPLLLGVIVLIAFGFWEAKPAAPIIPYRLFQSKTANMTLLGAIAHGMVMFTILQYIPLVYQSVNLETVIGSAVTLLPTSVVSVIVAAGSMMLVAAAGGGYTWVIRGAWVIMTLGTGLLALLNLSSSSSTWLGIPILWGVGVALLRLLLLPMQASVKNVDDTGLAIAQMLTFRLFGGLVGLAMAATIFSTVYSDKIASAGQLQGPLAPLNDPKNAIAFIPNLRTLDVSRDALDPVLKVYLASFRTIFYTLTGIAGLGLITSIFTDETSLDKTERGRQHFEENK
ncbi:MFS general substrate transporter [Polychaeton citri CBS 116435]|uniref:MFS general substrate transporter n=1 Tax=Polychaeton citri CBS 116435 TaxID=1314669 RepID=A0A9P4Q0K4_9PEZI|nr:MFS general substrate transporter [Polychaeton citri CBS 116435]